LVAPRAAGPSGAGSILRWPCVTGRDKASLFGWHGSLRQVAMDGLIARRRFLLGTAVGGITALAAARPAGAFTTESITPGSALGLAYANRCGPDSEHARIRAELGARLTSQAAAPSTTISASEVCPICGCPIYVSRTAN
jgi:hypothetical protein